MRGPIGLLVSDIAVGLAFSDYRSEIHVAQPVRNVSAGSNRCSVTHKFVSRVVVTPAIFSRISSMRAPCAKTRYLVSKTTRGKPHA